MFLINRSKQILYLENKQTYKSSFALSTNHWQTFRTLQSSCGQQFTTTKIGTGLSTEELQVSLLLTGSNHQLSWPSKIIEKITISMNSFDSIKGGCLWYKMIHTKVTFPDKKLPLKSKIAYLFLHLVSDTYCSTPGTCVFPGPIGIL